MNQKDSGGQWNLLDSFDFNDSEPAMIFLSDSTDGITIADGIWIEPISTRVKSWLFY